MAGQTSIWPAIPHRACCSRTITTEHSPNKAWRDGVALSEDGMEQAGMGVGDRRFQARWQPGHCENAFRRTTRPAVYVNNGKGDFRDDTLRSGLAIETRFISWGIGIEDFDNDGALTSSGSQAAFIPNCRTSRGEPYRTPRILFRNLGDGHFEELTRRGGYRPSTLCIAAGAARSAISIMTAISTF